jgi:hypothetical protein
MTELTSVRGAAGLLCVEGATVLSWRLPVGEKEEEKAGLI